jgi:enoyl-[acyl-carrier protein] reductase III
VRVNVVSGGAVDTDALKFFPNREEILEEGLKRTPPAPDARRLRCCALPVSDRPDDPRQTLIVDGGHSIVA